MLAAISAASSAEGVSDSSTRAGAAVERGPAAPGSAAGGDALDVLVLGHAVALGEGIGDHAGHEAHGPDRVVVAGDREIDLVGVAVRVDDRDHGDAQLPRLVDGDVLLLRVDHEDRVGEPLEVLDAAEVARELVALVAQADRFLLGQVVERAGALHLVQLAQAQQPLGDRREVREHAAEPAVVHERHADARRVLLHDFLGLLLRADEQHDAAAAAEALHELVGLLEAREGLLEVDDVDAGTLPVQESLHLRVPPARLVAEVHARLEELPPGDDRHEALLLGCCPPPGSFRRRPAS